MNSVEQARAIVFRHARPPQPERWRLLDSQGLVLAENVTSPVDSPPFDKATMDGYAVLSEDIATGEAELELAEEITAGQIPTLPVTSGKTSRIMTGAPMPEGADAVVIVERSELVSGEPPPARIRLRDATVRPGLNVIARGTTVRRGDRVLSNGRLIGPIEVGVLSEIGVTEIAVFRTPVVTVLATGDELVSADTTPAPGQIRNSNGPMLAALAERAGGRVVNLGIARDDADELKRLIQQGLESDVLVLSGGVSAGVLDIVPDVFARLGIRQVFHKVRLKPGKPLWFGVSAGDGAQTLVFGLPGNPVSSFVCFELFVRPTVARLAGRPPGNLDLQPAVLATDHHHRGDRPTFYPGKCSGEHGADGKVHVEPLPWHGSTDLFTLAYADCLIVFPPGDRFFSAGERIDIYPLGGSALSHEKR
jgi:molybdopterin molybdotransferase